MVHFQLLISVTQVSLFHVKRYLPISTSMALMSLGLTPGIRLAWAKVSG